MASYNIDLTGEWKFHLGSLPKKEKLTNNDYHLMAEAGGAIYEYDLEKADWQSVTVPHDWLIDLPYDSSESAMNGYKRRGDGWYLRKFSLPNEDIESAKITFDGILGISTVYVNGIVAARNFSGYNRFSAEIGDYLLKGEENTVVIYVDAQRGEGWFYEGAGIYRKACIEIREFSHIEKEECFARTEERNGEWYALCDLHLAGENFEGLAAHISIKDKNGFTVISETKKAEKAFSVSLL